MTVRHDQHQGAGPSRVVLWLLNNSPAILAIVTVVGSAALAVAAPVLKLSELEILQAVVVLLAVIGASLLTERLIEGRALRKRLSGIAGQLDKALEYTRHVETTSLDDLVISRRDLSPLEERFEGAKKISISGGSLFRLANEYKSLFERLLENGCEVRFLLSDPHGPSAELLSSAVVYESSDVASYRTQMRSALSGLSSLASCHPDVCEVRLYALAPPFSLVIVEKGNESSTILVEIYPFRVPARDRPILFLDKQRSPRLYALFSAQYEAMWSSKFSRRISPVRHELKNADDS
jgi:hypothetical protein